MFLLYTLNVFFGFLVWVLAVCCAGAQLFLWGRDFLWLVQEKDMYIFRENQTEVIGGKLDGQEYIVQEEKESAKKMTYQQWHEALGHPSPDYLKSNNYSDASNLPKVPKDWQCETSITSKSIKRKPTSITDICTDTPFELIHSDLSAKFSKTSFGKSNYYVTFIDDCTRYAWIYPIHAKSDTVTVFTSFIYARYTQDNAIIKTFRTDHGEEYVNAAMLTLLDKQGIVRDLSPAYSHESNGVAERYNRTIITAARSLLTGLPLALWAEAIATALYLRNRLPNRSIGKSTLYESLYNKKPSIYHLRPYGTKCLVDLPEEKRQPRTKLIPRAIEGYLIGYTSSDKIYGIYIPSQPKVTKARQIHWTTKRIASLGTTAMEPLLAEETYATVYPLSRPLPSIEVEKETDQDRNRQINPPTSKELSLLQTRFSESSEPPGTPLPAFPEEQRQDMPPAAVDPTVEIPGPSRRSGRISTQSSISYKKQLGHQVRHATSEIPDENSTTYRKAGNSSLKGEWTSAMNDEIIALKKNKTCDVVNKPRGRNIVGSKWVFKIEKNADGTLERFRARAVAQGFSQAAGCDFEDTFASVIRYESLRLLIAISARNKWRPRQFDVKSAFLYGKLKEDVYMRPPPGFNDGDKI